MMGLVGMGLLAISLPAQGSDLSGTWSASSLRVSWAIGDWGDACGPRPSGGGEKGGQVTLTSDGGGFRLNGLGRSYSTTQCWEQMPGLATRNRSTGASTISATCSMPAGDPRQAKVITSWYPRGDEIYFDETGQYQFVVSGSNCTASVRRTRILTRVIPATPTKPEEKAAVDASSDKPLPTENPSAALPPAPERSSQCKTPGRATQVEVAPRTKLMRQGENFTFQVNARDSAGCRVPIPARWKLISGQGALLSDAGELRVEKNAPPGDLKLEFQVDDQRLSVTARVVTEREYETLLAGGNFGALGESQEAAATDLTSSHVELDSPKSVEEQQVSRWWLALIGGLLVLFAGAALALMRRSAKRNTRKSKKVAVKEVLRHPPVDSAVAEAPIQPLRNDSPIVSPEPAPLAPPVLPEKVAAPSRLCPVCGKRYDDGTAFCGEDGARLMRAN